MNEIYVGISFLFQNKFSLNNKKNLFLFKTFQQELYPIHFTFCVCKDLSFHNSLVYSQKHINSIYVYSKHNKSIEFK